MLNSFNKFKKKIQKERLIKSIIFSLSLGLIIFSAPWIYIKLKEITFNLLILGAIGLGVSIITFVILYFIIKPSDYNIAKRIDEQLNLNEKVQTMIEYKDNNDDMACLQREDTLEILSKTPLKNLAMKFSIFLFLILFIACSACVTAIAIPSKEDDVSNDPDIILPPDPNYDLDNWTTRALLDLIEEVEASTINEGLKSQFVSLLQGLITELEKADKESEMTSLVNNIIEKVKLELDKVNTNNEVYTVLKESKNYSIMDLAIMINQLKVEEVEKCIENFIPLINGNGDAITILDDDFGLLLRKSLLDTEESLFKALNGFSNELKTCVNELSVNDAVIAVVNKNKPIIVNVISKQKENKEMADYIERQLIDIFGLGNDEEDSNLDDNNDPSNNDSDIDPDELEDNNLGGYGTGDFNFGSDDAFFDPESGKVVYGDVVYDYYGEILGKFNEGNMPEELKEIFEKYFDILLGMKEETGE